jgi:crotonobetainyl-CoA:carnitine CoA-transferase CaiB-like acyl-CoA transferase
MPGPLEGIKVLDLTAFINGPSATGQMCEQGADVLKVEPATGESMRASGGGPGVYFAGFEMYNRGKRSMTLDLKHKVL